MFALCFEAAEVKHIKDHWRELGLRVVFRMFTGCAKCWKVNLYWS